MSVVEASNRSKPTNPRALILKRSKHSKLAKYAFVTSGLETYMIEARITLMTSVGFIERES